MCTLVNRVASALVAAVLVAWSVPVQASITSRSGPTNLLGENRQFYKFDAAFDSVNNVYLIVWGTQAFGPTNGLFLDAAGNPIGGRFDISGGGQWAGWARVIFAKEEGKFLVSYTKILGSASHQRVARFVTYQSGSAGLSTEIPIDSWAGGAGGQTGMAYVPANSSRGARFLVTWWNNNANPPQSYVAVLDASGNVLGSHQISRDGDGQTDSEIACDAARDRCMVIGFSWGIYSSEVSPSVAGMPATWGRYISASTGEPLGAGFIVDAWRDENDASITFSEAGDRYIVGFARNFRTVWGVTVDGSSLSRSAPYLIKQSLDPNVDGGGYGRPRLAYNSGSQTTFVAMNPWIARTSVQELDTQGQPVADGFDMMPARTGDYNQGTKEVALAADGNNKRFMVADNQAFILLRAAVYSVGVATPIPCSYSINPTTVSLSPGAADGTIFVTTQPGCAWEATSHNGFIGIQNGTGRSGSGSLPFTVAANSGGARSGTATIAGVTFTVNQASGIVVSCSYSINPTSVSLGSLPADGSITVTTQAGCGWSAVSQSAFITFTNGSGRSGSGSVSFSVAGNFATSARSGSATVAGQTFSVSQQPADLDQAAKTASNSRADFNGDGNNDLLLQDTVGGELVVWRLQGNTVVAGTALSHRILDNRWRVVGTGDFNSDGKPDIVWQHTTEGWMYVWFMDGVTRVGSSYLSINRLLDTRWRAVAVGDFNSDGKPDIIWEHPDGWLAAWLMDGITIQNSLNLSPGSVLDTQWRIAGAGDFNGDGKLDLVWRHAGHGEVGVWLMNGLTRGEYAPLKPGIVGDQDWRIAAVIDVNGDNTPDLVWEHAPTGWTAVWYMNGLIRGENPSLSHSVPPNWRIMAAK